MMMAPGPNQRFEIPDWLELSHVDVNVKGLDFTRSSPLYLRLRQLILTAGKIAVDETIPSVGTLIVSANRK